MILVVNWLLKETKKKYLLTSHRAIKFRRLTAGDVDRNREGRNARQIKCNVYLKFGKNLLALFLDVQYKHCSCLIFTPNHHNNLLKINDLLICANVCTYLI